MNFAPVHFAAVTLFSGQRCTVPLFLAGILWTVPSFRQFLARTSEKRSGRGTLVWSTCQISIGKGD